MKKTPIKIPVFRPSIGLAEREALIGALDLGWLGMGSYVEQFEQSIARICGFNEDNLNQVVAVSTGHAALHLSLVLAGVGPGDEVITPSFNNIADLQAIRACGANPVFVDIKEETLCIDGDEIPDLVSPRTKCIIAMDYGNSFCDHKQLSRLSEDLSIPIVHDAAHSFGADYEGVPIGQQHAFTMFSFDPVKIVTCIDGGAIIVRSAEQVQQLREMRLIGMTQKVSDLYSNSRTWTYDVRDIGFRYHLANPHAAVGLAQLSQLKSFQISRLRTCLRYSEAFANIEWLEFPNTISEHFSSSPFLYYVLVKFGFRERFRAHLRSKGIDTGIHWIPGHEFQYFRTSRRGKLSSTEKIAKEIVSLPLHSNMTPDEVTLVIDAVLTFGGIK